MAEARQRANEARRTLALDSKLGPTVEEWLAHWLERGRGQLQPSTWQTYESYARLHIVPTLGGKRLDALTVEDVEAWHDGLAADLAPTTAHHVHVTLQTALLEAAKRGHRVSVALTAVGTPQRRRKDIQTLSRGEAGRLIEGVRDDPLGAAYILAVTVGLRSGELRALSWRDVDLERRSITIRTAASQGPDGIVLKEPKTNAGRRTIFPLPAVCVDALQRTPGRSVSGLVFPDSQGRPRTASALHKAWLQTRDRLGLSHVSFHALRHTAATHALEDGLPAHVVAEMLGHASIATTLSLYAHVTHVSRESVARAVDARYGATEQP